MRIAIVGTGAVGGWYAALLAEAGHEVHCVARADHAVIRARGLEIRAGGSASSGSPRPPPTPRPSVRATSWW